MSGHRNIFGVNAIWDFFDSGHGKGPCNGIGGTSKRTADLAIRQGKITVQDAPEYFERAQKYHTSAKYIYVESTECTDSRLEVADYNKRMTPLKGTMQVHCVVGVSKGVIKTTITSCYCQDCLKSCFHDYSLTNLMKGEKTSLVVEAEHDNNIPNQDVETGDLEAESDRIEVNIAVGLFVAAIYDNAWHVGKITDIDEAYQVTFMRPIQARNTGNPLYKKDKIMLQVTDILCNLREPMKVGRSGRSYEDYKNACNLLEVRSKS